MRFDLLTALPEWFDSPLSCGITRRAFQDGGVDVRRWPLRDFADGAYRRIDDRPFGGGPGMVMLAEPLERALAAVRKSRQEASPDDPALLIHFTPTGRRIDQRLIEALAAGPGAVLLCGRYEGIDQRFLDRHQPLELSLGDFVLSGGELAAMVLMDAVARLQPGVMREASHEQDSFSGDGLLEGPHYSRPEQLPESIGGASVPEVLLSGHHARIERWRREQSLTITRARRPELLEAARAAGRLSREDEAFLRQR
jgi:tRNA (guanine37-N1)-methyltransferase